MIYAVLDAQAMPVGFYPDDVYPPTPTYGPVPDPTPENPQPVAPVIGSTRNSAIPAAAIEITTDQWADCIANPGLRKWNGTTLVPYAPPTPAPVVPEQISARQFFMQAVADGDISESDALGFMMGGTLPQALAAGIAQLPADQQFGAKMAFCGSTFDRSNPMTPQIGALFGKTGAQLDAFWIAASAL